MSHVIATVNHSLQGKGRSGSVLQLDTSLPGGWVMTWFWVSHASAGRLAKLKSRCSWEVVHRPSNQSRELRSPHKFTKRDRENKVVRGFNLEGQMAEFTQPTREQNLSL